MYNNIILLTSPSTELFVFSVVGEGQKLQADVPPVNFLFEYHLFNWLVGGRLLVGVPPEIFLFEYQLFRWLVGGWRLVGVPHVNISKLRTVFLFFP